MDKNLGGLLKMRGRFLLIVLFKITERFPQKEAEYLTDQIRKYSVSILTDITHSVDCSESKQFHPLYFHLSEHLERLEKFVQNAHRLFYIEDIIYFKIHQIIHDLGHLLSRCDENRDEHIGDYQDCEVCHYHV